MSVPARGLFKLGTNAPGIYGSLADLRPYLLDDAVGLANVVVVFDDPYPFRDPSSHKSTLISFAMVGARAECVLLRNILLPARNFFYLPLHA